MKHQVTLNTGAKMPAIGFGTWKIFPNSSAKKAVIDAVAAGYRLIDTARIYGNEKGVGRAIHEVTVPRGELFVTTKLWNANQGYKRAHKAFNSSLKRLGLDYIDLYLIHWPVSGKRLDSWRALEEIYKSGRARAIGVSNFTIKHLEELAEHSSITPAVNQVECHPFLYDRQKELLAYCRKHKIILEAYSPLAHGQRLNDPLIGRLAKKYSKSNAQILLRWALQQGAVPLPKSTHAERIHENLDIFNFIINQKDTQAINELSDGTRTCWNPENMP